MQLVGRSSNGHQSKSAIKWKFANKRLEHSNVISTLTNAEQESALRYGMTNPALIDLQGNSKDIPSSVPFKMCFEVSDVIGSKISRKP